MNTVVMNRTAWLSLKSSMREIKCLYEMLEEQNRSSGKQTRICLGLEIRGWTDYEVAQGQCWR